MKKRFFKKLIMSAASLCLALFIAVGFAFSPAASVSAAVVQIETITEGETWSESWDSTVQSMSVKLDVDETGFYNITFTDRNQTGYVLITVTDNTDEQNIEYVTAIGCTDETGEQFLITDSYTSNEILLIADHKYELICYYIDDNFNFLAADLSIEFNASDTEIAQLPDCALSSSDLQAQFTSNDYEAWLKFTTSAAGDYSLNFTDLHAYVSVYSAQTGELVYSFADTEYLYGYEYVYDEYDDEYKDALYKSRDKLVFNLSGNTEYYFLISAYEESSTKLSMTQNSDTVKNIAVSGAISSISYWDGDSIDEFYFNYKITYTNGSVQTKRYGEIGAAGYEQPFTMFLGEYVEVNGELWLEGGKAPVVSYYNNEYTFIYVNVLSLTDMISGYAIGDYENVYGELKNEGTDLMHACYKVKVRNTGTYDFVTLNDAEGDDWDKISIYSIAVIDDKNNIVNFNDAQNGWPLVAGDEYALCILCNYKSEYSGNIDFVPEMKSDKLFPDTNKSDWYYNAVTYAVGRGIMTGYQNGKFGTSDGIQRQDFLVMLARLDGVDLDAYASQHGIFPDVEANSYYEAAVVWGYENGIVTGYENGKFGVGDKITREQIVTFLYRYASYALADTSYYDSTQNTVKNKYSDYKNISSFANDAMLWAIEKGVINGKTSSTIVPQGNAQRCEVAQIMYNIFKNDVL